MDILCFTDSLVSGGAQRQLVNLAILLKREGHNIRFLVYRDIPFYKHYLDEEGIALEVIKCNNYLKRIAKIGKYLRHYNGDIVISFLETPNFLSCLAAAGKHRWKLITNELSAKDSSFVGIRNKIFKWFERYSDWTVCNSKNAEKMWIEHYPQYRNRISTIYNPILLLNVNRNNEKVGSIGKRNVLIAASYQYLKNPVRVIEAVSQLDDSYKQCLHIDWYGRKEPSKGEVEAAIEAEGLIKKYHLEETISLHEETKDIYQQMQLSDAVGLFSELEGLPNAILEGMALRKPILMSKVSDYEILVTTNGFLCDPFDVSSIRECFKNFLDCSDAELKKMGDESYEKAIRMFSPNVIISQWNNLFIKLVSIDKV